MKNTLDFSGPILAPDGTASPNTKLGDLLSMELMQSNAKPPISAKYFAWGVDLAKTGVIEVDDTDKQSIIEFIGNSERMTVLGKGRLLEAINKVPNDTLVQL